MSYTHLTMEEFGWIETYLTLDLYAPQIADKLGRSKTAYLHCKTFLDTVQSMLDYYQRYKEIRRYAVQRE